MLSYLALGLAAVIPAVFRRYGKLWLGSETHPAAVGIIAFMACGIVLTVVDSAEVANWPVAAGWTLVTVGGFVFGGRILRAAGVPEPRSAAVSTDAGAALVEAMEPEERRDFETAWAGLMAWGVMLILIGLPLAYWALVTREFSAWALLVLPLGALSTWGALALKRGRWRAGNAVLSAALMAPGLVAALAALDPSALTLLALPLGALMTWGGSALKRGQERAWNAAVMVKVAAMALFPAVLMLGETRWWLLALGLTWWATQVWCVVRRRPLFRGETDARGAGGAANGRGLPAGAWEP